MDTFQMLCSASNWFQSSLCDVSSDGIVAMGTHNKITLLSVKTQTEQSQFGYSFIGEFLHNDRVNACKFCFISSRIQSSKQSNHSFIECLVSGSNDGSIRIWDILQKKCLILSKHAHFGSITAMTTNNHFNGSKSAKTLIIFGNAKGFIFCWNAVTNNRSQRRLSDSAVMTLKYFDNEKDDDESIQIVVGFKSGKLLLLKVSEFDISNLLTFKGHDAAIQSIACCHAQNNAPTTNFIVRHLPNLFVSASKDQTMRFWNALSGECVLEIGIESNSKMHGRKRERMWLCVLWPFPFKLFVTDSNGKIYSVDLKKYNFETNLCLDRSGKTNGIRSFEQAHTRCIFNLNLIRNRDRILSLSLDRNIAMYDSKTLKIKWKMPTLGGYCYALDIAKWTKNDHQIAIACGDKMIRIWSEKSGKCKVLWKGLKDSITAIQWHPTDREWLLYGTNRGVIGCMDIRSADSSKSHRRFLSFHRTCIRSVHWKLIGSAYRDQKKKKGKAAPMSALIRAYSLSADGLIFESNGWQPNAPSIDINQHILSQNKRFKQSMMKWTCLSVEAMDVSVHANGQKAVIGDNEGKIFVFDANWKILQCFDGANAPISCIQINPFLHDKTICAGTENGDLLFYNFPTDESNEVAIQFKLKHCAKNKAAVSKVKWHPFFCNVVVSVSNSNKYPLVIWDLSKQRKIFEIESSIGSHPKIAHFTKYHHAKIVSAAWSRSDAMILFTGSEDQTCRRLDIGSFADMDANISNLCQMEPRIFKCSQSSQPIIDETVSSKQSNSNSNKSKLRTKKHRKLFQSLDGNKIDESLMDLVRYFVGFIDENFKKSNQRTLAPQDALFCCVSDIEKEKVSKWMSEVLHPPNCGVLDVSFLSNPCEQILHFLQNECESVIDCEIETFIASKSVPKLPSLISLLMSPTLGRQKWIKSMLKLCEYFKHPQVALYHNAAAIYLSIKSPQFIRECIAMYIECEYYLEALVVARFHLVSSHPIIEEILCRFAKKSLVKKQFVLAIKCYLAKLSMHAHLECDAFIDYFIQIVKENVFGTLIKHCLVHFFSSNDSKKKRKIGKMEVYALQILHDLIVLLHSLHNDKISAFLIKDVGAKQIGDIFEMYTVLKLCLYDKTTSIQKVSDSIAKWPLIGESEMYLWKLLFEFVHILEMDKDEMIKLDDKKPMKNRKISQRIDHFLNSHHLPKSKEQNKRIHCVQFANFLLEIFIFHKASNQNEIDLTIWKAINYATNNCILSILHRFIRCMQAFHVQSSVPMDLIFATLQMILSENENDADAEQMMEKYEHLIKEMVKSKQSSFKCTLMLTHMALFLFSIDCKTKAEIETNLDKSFWICVQNILQNQNIQSIDALISKCIHPLLNSNNPLRDPYVVRLKSRQIARKCM